MTERLPDPPATLPALRRGEVISLTAPVGRLYFVASLQPATWDSFRGYGPVPSMRFDHQPPPPREHPTRRISYLAPSGARRLNLDPLVAAVRETFASTTVIDTVSEQPWFTLWTPTRPLRLLDVVDCPWISRVGGNAAISSGSRAQARAWSRVGYRSYGDVDGTYYETSSTPTHRSIALFERAVTAVPVHPDLNVPLNHLGLRPALERIAGTYDMYLLT